MSLYHTFAPASRSNARAAAAAIELTQLQGIPLHLSVVRLDSGKTPRYSAMLYCDVDGHHLEKVFSFSHWKRDPALNCELEVQRILMNENFIYRVLERMAKDIAGLTGRNFIGDVEAKAFDQAVSVVNRVMQLH